MSIQGAVDISTRKEPAGGPIQSPSHGNLVVEAVLLGRVSEKLVANLDARFGRRGFLAMASAAST